MVQRDKITGGIEVTHSWVDEFPGSITVCDSEGKILEMNARAIKSYEKDGGEKLIGTNLLNCHPQPARGKVEQLLSSQQPNIYTIEKNGKRKIIYQSPWFKDGVIQGFVELSLEIPEQMPHFIRGG